MLGFFQIDVLEAEVTALKKIVLASTPDVPKVDSLPVPNIKTGGLTSLLKGHKRSGSHTGAIEKRRDVSPPPEFSVNNNSSDTFEVLNENQLSIKCFSNQQTNSFFNVLVYVVLKFYKFGAWNATNYMYLKCIQGN